MQKSTMGFSFKRKQGKKAFLEDVSGKAPGCWAIELVLPLHNLLLPRRTEYFKQKLCTKKVHHNKKKKLAQLAGLAT